MIPVYLVDTMKKKKNKVQEILLAGWHGIEWEPIYNIGYKESKWGDASIKYTQAQRNDIPVHREKWKILKILRKKKTALYHPSKLSMYNVVGHPVKQSTTLYIEKLLYK